MRNNFEHSPNITRKTPSLGLAIAFLLLAAFVVLTGAHFGTIENFLKLLREAEPEWLILAVIAQILTYISSGLLWHVAMKPSGYRLPIKSLARLSLEQLSVDQLIPTGGIAGNAVIARAMGRLGLPNWLAVKLVFIDIFAYHAAYTAVTLGSFFLLWLHHGITPVIISLVGIFFAFEFVVVSVIWAVANHRKIKLPRWITERKFVSRLLSILASISPQDELEKSLIVKASLFRLAIFLLDAVTLWVVIHSFGVAIEPTTAFIALVLGSVAGTLTLLPGGIGGFEAGSVALLTLLGISIEAALTATIVFRGLTLWIPLVPGLIFAHDDLMPTRNTDTGTQE